MSTWIRTIALSVATLWLVGCSGAAQRQLATDAVTAMTPTPRQLRGLGRRRKDPLNRTACPRMGQAGSAGKLISPVGAGRRRA